MRCLPTLSLVLLGVACNVENSGSAGDGLRDADGDGFREDEDCNDKNGDIYPGADELCNEIDDDCDEEVDEEAVDAVEYFTDADADGFGDGSTGVSSCVVIADTVTNGDDCLDDDETVNPDGTEVCNDGLDNDCDGTFNDCALDEEVDLAASDVRLLGEENGDLAGYAVAAVDMDGDGVDDLVVGAPGFDGEAGGSTGAAYVLMGPTSGTIGLSAADAVWEGASTGDSAGWAVQSAGDVNNDNLPDVVVGAPSATYEGSQTGVAYLLLGPATSGGSLDEADAILYALTFDAAGGYAVSGVGDISGDGTDDLLVSATSAGGGAGAVYLLHGPLEGEIALSAANATLQGSLGAEVGSSVAAAGDLNGDGTADFLVGARGLMDTAGTVGAAYVVFGPVVGEVKLTDIADGRILGVADEDLAGHAVAGAGDINGDGLDDALIGAPQDDTNGSDAGAAFLFLGPASSTTSTATADARFVGEHEQAYAGTAVSGGVDVNQDGTPDILVGAFGTNYEPSGSSGRVDAGAAYAVYGPASGLVSLSAADVIMGGAEARSGAGWSGTLSPDATGDAVPDLLIGAPGISATDEAGSVLIVAGQGL